MSLLKRFGDIDVEKLLSLARIAETSERYKDMCIFTSELVKLKCKNNEKLNMEERNLLSVAFKNVVGSKRGSWRTLNQEHIEDVDEQTLIGYRQVVEKELQQKCEEILDLLNKYLIPTSKNEKDETAVFYLKMNADYCRYLAEFLPNSKYPNEAKEMYSKAMEASSKLQPTHPTRLGLCLNFSVCHYEILKQPDQACKLAKEAFDSAIQSLDNLDDNNYKDSTLIMQLLRDNLTLWTSEQGDEEEDEEDDENDNDDNDKDNDKDKDKE